MQDESISTSYSSDSALEIASRQSEPVPNAYASPQICRRAFPTAPSPTEHLSKFARSTASRRPPPRLTLSVPESSIYNENPCSTVTESPPASPDPIIFASPSSSAFSFRTPFPSLDPLSKTSDASSPVPPNPHTPSKYNDYANVNANANSNAHIRPDHASHADSYSTVGSTACPAESSLPSTPAPTRKPWHDFAKDNSREPSPSPLSGKDSKRSIDDHHTISPGSRRVLSTIQATTPLSSNRSHTLSLSLTRPAHARTSSSTSLFTPTKSPFRSNSISSPPLTPRLSSPSRSSSPAPARPSESEQKSHQPSRSRPNSMSLLRSISDRSKARFSRSIHTGDVSIGAIDYAAAQCEAAFVSETLHDQEESATNAEILVEERAAEIAKGEMESIDEVQIIELDAVDKVHHRSMLGKMKKFGGKVRKLVRVMRASLPSVGVQSEEHAKARVAILRNSQDAAVGLHISFVRV